MRMTMCVDAVTKTDKHIHVQASNGYGTQSIEFETHWDPKHVYIGAQLNIDVMLEADSDHVLLVEL